MIQRILNNLGYKISNIEKEKNRFPGDFEAWHIAMYKSVSQFTMTSRERIFAAIEATKFLVKNGIKGDIVECGVWKGGTIMAILETLSQLGDYDRKVYLYDTFEGMPPPTEKDKTNYNASADELLNANKNKGENTVWAYSPIDEVKKNIAQTKYNPANIHFVKGKVEETIPETLPDNIALLRLDTDWYESTRHEMEHLYPLLVKNGVLIIDDYGHWQGARKAVDEYIETHNIPLLLNRIDDTGRIAIKS